MAGYDHVTRDLAFKAGEDACAAVKRVLACSPDGVAEKAMIATMATGHIMALAAAYFTHKVEDEAGAKPPPESAVDALWSALRPIVLDTVSSFDNSPTPEPKDKTNDR